ncbi:hypothetical protein D3C74_282810 [compost metagenome]
MNLFDFIREQRFSAFLRFPERIQRIHFRYDREVVFRNRRMRAPFQRTSVPRISGSIPFRIAEAPVDVVNQNDKPDGEPYGPDRSDQVQRTKARTFRIGVHPPSHPLQAEEEQR